MVVWLVWFWWMLRSFRFSILFSIERSIWSWPWVKSVIISGFDCVESFREEKLKISLPLLPVRVSDPSPPSIKSSLFWPLIMSLLSLPFMILVSLRLFGFEMLIWVWFWNSMVSMMLLVV